MTVEGTSVDRFDGIVANVTRQNESMTHENGTRSMPFCKIPDNCSAVESNFQFWFHGVVSLCLNAGGLMVSVLMLPLLVYLFVNERKNPRMAAQVLSEFYLLLSILLVSGVFHAGMEMWEWSLRHTFYFVKVQHDELKIFQDPIREISETTFVYVLVFMTFLRHRTTKIVGPFGLRRLWMVVLGIFLFSILYILPTCFTKVPGPGCFDPCLNRVVHRLIKTDLRTKNRLYIIIYKWNLTLIISFLVPFGFLLVLNAKIVYALKKNQRKKATMRAATTKKGESKAKQLQNKIYRICLWVTIVFLLNRLPYFISLMIRYGGELSGNKEIEQTEQFKTFSGLCIFLATIHPTMTVGALVTASHVLRSAFPMFYCAFRSKAESMRRSGLLTERLGTTRRQVEG